MAQVAGLQPGAELLRLRAQQCGKGLWRGDPLAIADVIDLERREREAAQKSALLARQRLLEASKSA